MNESDSYTWRPLTGEISATQSLLHDDCFDTVFDYINDLCKEYLNNCQSQPDGTFTAASAVRALKKINKAARKLVEVMDGKEVGDFEPAAALFRLDNFGVEKQNKISQLLRELIQKTDSLPIMRGTPSARNQRTLVRKLVALFDKFAVNPTADEENIFQMAVLTAVGIMDGSTRAPQLRQNIDRIIESSGHQQN